MRTRTIATCMAFGLAVLGSVGQPAVAADVTECVGCHGQMGMSLKSAGVDAITAKVKDIASGKNTMHAPVLAGASDEDIAAIAAALNEAG